ncbi:hypothetical protein [Azohydromonas sp.]|uniref:hypothetical protein n=1 Tax=Azohydromonas sp. TaxID=1872666 RepID=UPI002B8106F4|nr:hypothetical protein [Azohydromonas sp.]HMM87513.1 hypothetical protein [Azohydromonas sp.]
MSKITSVAAAVLIAAAASASAQEATYELPQPATSATTRAAVADALREARAQGTLQATEYDRHAWSDVASTRTRAEVRAEARAAAERGELQALIAEPMGFDGPVIRHDARGDATAQLATTRS